MFFDTQFGSDLLRNYVGACGFCYQAPPTAAVAGFTIHILTREFPLWRVAQLQGSQDHHQIMASAKEPPNGNESIVSKLDMPSTDILNKSPVGNSPSFWEQAVRVISFVVWFTAACLAIVSTQFIGVPLAFWDKNLFYA
jgi:hypothetical protein